jgi:putative transposase
LTKEEKLKMLDKEDSQYGIRAQCRILGINRSGLYYEPVPISQETLEIMGLLDEEHTRHPFYGVKKMTKFLKDKGYKIGKDKVRTLLRSMGLEAIYPKPNTSIPNKQHKIYPYLLKDVEITQPNQVWSADITYIRLNEGFVYLVAIIDWYSRYVVSWQLSNSLDAGFCVEALKEALKKGKPEIFNTDQGCQFTSTAFTDVLEKEKISISMDAKGKVFDNIFTERLWRTVKYEDIYIKGYHSIPETQLGLAEYFDFYNNERYHQALDYKTPGEMFSVKQLSTESELLTKKEKGTEKERKATTTTIKTNKILV